MHANRVLGPTIAIAPGTIDADDRGEVCGALVNTRSTSGGARVRVEPLPLEPAHSLYDQVMAHGIGPSRDGPADARRRASLPSPGLSGASRSRPDRMLLHMHDWGRPVAEPEGIMVRGVGHPRPTLFMDEFVCFSGPRATTSRLAAMIDRFTTQLHEAIAKRRAARLPGVLSIVAAVTGCTLAYIMLAMIFIPANVPLEYHFVSEQGAVTALSALFLAAASTLSLAAMVTLTRAQDVHRWVWLMLACAFGFLALDELLEFHEHAGRLFDGFGRPGVFKSWNDVLVILYGVVTLPILIGILPALLRWRLVLEMFAIAFVLYAIHTLIDATNRPATTVSIIAEESAKLLCGAFLANGTFVGFVGIVWSNANVDTMPDRT